MREITINFNKSEIIKLFRSKVYKIAEAMANDQNIKAVYNIKHGGEADVVDDRISESFYVDRLAILCSILADYMTNTIETVNGVERDRIAIILKVPSTSTVTNAVITPAVKDYITDGMVCDWIGLTAPGAQKQFNISVDDAEAKIKRIIYSKTAPTPPMP